MKQFIDKLIKRLEDKIELTWKHDYMGGRKDAFREAIEIVNQLAEEYNNGWIACSDRLPEDYTNVLVWFEYFRYGEYMRLYQTTGISWTYKGEWSGFVNGTSGWEKLRIIAWQPLPPAYQPKGETKLYERKSKVGEYTDYTGEWV